MRRVFRILFIGVFIAAPILFYYNLIYVHNPGPGAGAAIVAFVFSIMIWNAFLKKSGRRKPKRGEVEVLRAANEALFRRNEELVRRLRESPDEDFVRKAEAIVADVACALINWERGKGKISAEYTLYLLKERLKADKAQNFEEVSKAMNDIMGDKIDEMINASQDASRQYTEAFRNYTKTA